MSTCAESTRTAVVGHLLADHPRGVEPLCGVRRRHSDVGHHEIRLLAADHLEQLRPVTGLGDDLETRTFEQAGQPLAQKHIVVGHHNADRIRHRTSSQFFAGRAGNMLRECMQFYSDPQRPSILTTAKRRCRQHLACAITAVFDDEHASIGSERTLIGRKAPTRRTTIILAAVAALAALPSAAVSGVAAADPGIGWGAPGPGILPGPGLGGVGGPLSGLGVLPGAGFGLPGVGVGGVGGPGSGLGVLPGVGWGLPGPGLI